MMAWQKYALVFRLQSPLHIGYRKVGNLMQTRGYVPGKILWAALTARLTRDYDDGANGKQYETIGRQVQKYFRFTYLYPATQNSNGFKTHYPWEDDFDYLFLHSYASTALDYTSQSAEDAMLHETEFIAPYTRTGQPVYLTGDLFVKTDLPTPLDKWQDVLHKLQLGAERGYGWGRVQLVSCKKVEKSSSEPHGYVHHGRITAHLRVKNASNVQGPIEVLIGWERNNDPNQRGEWKLGNEPIICYAPGAMITKEGNFQIVENGLWKA